MKFSFHGSLGASKSALNRALILKSYFPDLNVEGSSNCDDVKDLQKCLLQIDQRNEFEIGEGGTTFRFLCLRLSRKAGEFKIKASKRLLARPQDELLDILSQVGVTAEKYEWGFLLNSKGWREPKSPLRVDRGRSSQFLSSVVLNSPVLDFPLEIETQGPALSEDYLRMTLQMGEEYGIEMQTSEGRLRILPWKTLKEPLCLVGADLSSAFSLACFAAIAGELNVLNVFRPSLQPDFKFVSAFQDMNIPVQVSEENILVNRALDMLPAALDLSSAPDLFPMMACLCSQISGISVLAGAPQLKFKESDRLKKVFELFDLAKISYERLSDGIKIFGKAQPHLKSFEFDPDEDHRMAMAAGFLKFCGWNIKVKNPHVVNKSFPEFWDITKVAP